MRRRHRSYPARGQEPSSRRNRVQVEAFLSDHKLLSVEQQARLADFMEGEMLTLAGKEKRARRDAGRLVNSWLDLGCLMDKTTEELKPGAPNVAIWVRPNADARPWRSYSRASWSYHGAYPIKVRAPIAARQATREEKILGQIEGLDGEKWLLIFRSFRLETLEEALVFCAGYCVQTWAMPQIEKKQPDGTVKFDDRPVRSMANGMALEWVLAWRQAEGARIGQSQGQIVGSSARDCSVKT